MGFAWETPQKAVSKKRRNHTLTGIKVNLERRSLMFHMKQIYLGNQGCFM